MATRWIRRRWFCNVLLSVVRGDAGERQGSGWDRERWFAGAKPGARCYRWGELAAIDPKYAATVSAILAVEWWMLHQAFDELGGARRGATGAQYGLPPESQRSGCTALSFQRRDH